ncbi:hypothetical protein OnM2_c2562o11 [Erysiphe neolycopersici]|uniref:Uncharacterized protein n=1 Tax=Erysiphe neolycopersici TaxID=212602 RepID=A0A420HZJ5_9PEZI|nr:hypothetical protein OnM2_c2562o11 [Erysiphe neolycopersici]
MPLAYLCLNFLGHILAYWDCDKILEILVNCQYYEMTLLVRPKRSKNLVL